MEKKVPHIRLYTYSSDFKIPTFFLHLQTDLSRWCFTQHIYSKSWFVHICFELFLAESADRTQFCSGYCFQM